MTKTQRYVFTVDLKEDPELIVAYEQYHQQVWPEIKESIREAGIVEMEIYRWENRLFMLMEVDSSFSFEKKAALDQNNPKVQEWETLMWNYQQALPGTAPGEKWQRMKQVFALNA